ncbi:hypothetical protein [Thorsellia anophelis]|uniref:Uncharacterized protein n=1 Tax=Thorsellia anophelis DSM 18579 TaxID=1123402 RepID=A0A1I0AL85_9GAMM|nr:hypothetical protein [Thorsellia anophelis]SES95122.1 hypothetical protein SAMN02583745_00965 [Thorsellia anophelis DSM 18579]
MLKNKVLISVLASLMVNSLVHAAPPNSTLGFFSLPNDLFPSHPPYSFGSTLQQTTAENNPDVWCKDQANGYRTPKASDMSEAHVAIVPPEANPNGLTGGSERKASLSLYNEWGNVKQYPGSGWDETLANTKFWVAEPASANERYTYEITTGELTATGAGNSQHVVCVASI